LLDTGNMRVVVVGVEACEWFRLEPLLGRGGRLVEYVVLGVQHDPSGHVGASFMMSWAQVVRASDVGKKDAAVFTVKTHLGYDLEPGCHALGYDLCGDNAYSHGLEKYGQSHKLPAAVLTTTSRLKRLPRPLDAWT
jgi:nonsense-mediated mRNA decay protein 3